MVPNCFSSAVEVNCELLVALSQSMPLFTKVSLQIGIQRMYDRLNRAHHNWDFITISTIVINTILPDVSLKE